GVGRVGEEKVADCFGRAVGGERGEVEVVDNQVRKWRAINRHRGTVDDLWPIILARMTDRLEERPGAIEIGAIAFVEIDLGLGRDNSGEVEDEFGPPDNGGCRCTGRCKVAGMQLDTSGKGRWLSRRDHIEER